MGDAEYDEAGNIEDNQDKFYVIKQSRDYNLFSMLEITIDSMEVYKADERENIKGFMFQFTRGKKTIWAYQLLYQNAIPNKKKSGFCIISSDGDIFY